MTPKYKVQPLGRETAWARNHLGAKPLWREPHPPQPQGPRRLPLRPKRDQTTVHGTWQHTPTIGLGNERRHSPVRDQDTHFSHTTRPHHPATTRRCHSTENLYRYEHGNLIRASDDFYPRRPASHTMHVVNVAYNSLLIGTLCRSIYCFTATLLYGCTALRIYCCTLYCYTTILLHSYATSSRTTTHGAPRRGRRTLLARSAGTCHLSPVELLYYHTRIILYRSQTIILYCTVTHCNPPHLVGEIGTPDWDMFTSFHEAAGLHAAARAIGGCATD